MFWLIWTWHSKTLLGTRCLGLGPGGRNPHLMHEVTGGAGHALVEVLGLLPVDVLLVVGLGELVAVKVTGVAAGKRRGLEKNSQCFAGLEAHGPLRVLVFGGLAAVVAGAADFRRYPRGKLGRVDDGLPLLEDGRLGQRRVPGALPVAGLAADGGLNEFLLVEVDPGGVAAAALEQPGVLFPGGLVVVHPAVGVGVVLNGCNVEHPALFDDVTLLPLAADGVLDVFDFGDENLDRPAPSACRRAWRGLRGSSFRQNPQ